LENKRVENKKIKASANFWQAALFIGKLDSILRMVLQQKSQLSLSGPSDLEVGGAILPALKLR
jgi:hypothetical protein